MDENEPLTAKQRLFVAEYLVDKNATQAAIRAGYSKKNAGKIGPELLGKTRISEAIDRQLAAQEKRVLVDADTVLKELLKIALSDLRKLFDEKGSLLPPEAWPADVALAVSSVEVDEIWQGRGKDRKVVGLTRKVKLWNKNNALELIGRHLKMFTDRLEVEEIDELAEKLKAARERRAKAKEGDK